MFGLFKKSPIDKLKQQHDELATRAFHAQRNGDIRSYSTLTAEAEDIRQKIESMEADQAG